MYEQGEIVVVPFPFSDLSKIKRRPVLILSKKDDALSSTDIITCAITSNMKESKYSILIDKENLSRGTIPLRSRIKVDKLFTIDNGIVIKRVAKLNAHTWSLVKKEFLSLV